MVVNLIVPGSRGRSACLHAVIYQLSTQAPVGGTFVGTVTISMLAAQRTAYNEFPGNLVAMMTLVYGIGQIIAPILANVLYAHSQTFSSSLLAATSALVVAALMSAWAP